jgi:hypothetical protein
MATALISAAAARFMRSFTFTAPPSIEHCVWTFRWTS